MNLKQANLIAYMNPDCSPEIDVIEEELEKQRIAAVELEEIEDDSE